MVAASSEAIGLRAMTIDYGDELQPWLYVDASAAIGVAQRTGLGKIRHLDTQSLWLQEAVRKRRIGLEKVKGTENPSDLMTKFTDLATLDKLCAIMGLVVRDGRAASAPKVTTSQGDGQDKDGKTEIIACIEDDPVDDGGREHLHQPARSSAGQSDCREIEVIEEPERQLQPLDRGVHHRDATEECDAANDGETDEHEDLHGQTCAFPCVAWRWSHADVAQTCSCDGVRVSEVVQMPDEGIDLDEMRRQ